jgi:DNA ligase-1
LKKLYENLEEHIIHNRHPRVDSRMEMDGWFEPKIVIEVIASEITLSPSHTAAENLVRTGFGLALRFPKFTGNVREDKSAEDATTADELVEMYGKQLKSSAPLKINSQTEPIKLLLGPVRRRLVSTCVANPCTKMTWCHFTIKSARTFYQN